MEMYGIRHLKYYNNVVPLGFYLLSLIYFPLLPIGIIWLEKLQKAALPNGFHKRFNDFDKD